MENIKFYCRLGEILKEKGVSASQLSKDIEHRRSTINDLINNQDIMSKRIPVQLIARLCAYFDVTPNDLFVVSWDKPQKEEDRLQLEHTAQIVDM